MNLSNVLTIIIIILSLASSVDTASILLCYKPEFDQAAYHGTLGAASPGTVLTLTCKEVFQLGSPITTCTDGQWTNPTPPCQLVKCQTKDLIRPNGLISYTCQGFGCVANLTCMEGYWYEGPMTKVCQRNATWSGPNVTCEAIQCVELPNLPNGNIHQNNRSYQAIVTVQCNEGFSYSKPESSSRQCQANNTWSGGEGSCEAIKCHKLPDLDNGKVLQDNRSYSAEAVMMCNTGYQYSEPSFTSRHCLANATWSGKQGFCRAEPCPQLAAIDNGMLSATSGSFNDQITLQCTNGYSLEGASSTYCLAGGRWSANIGICKGQTNSPVVWIPVALLIGLLVAVTAFYRYKRRSTNGPEHNETNTPLLPKGKVLYLRFAVTQSFGNEYGDESSSQYATFKSSIEGKVLNVMKEGRKLSRVEILRLQKPTTIFLRIISEDSIEQGDVSEALAPITIPSIYQGELVYNISREPIIFYDEITDHVKIQILQGKHIRDHKSDFEIDLDSEFEELRIIRHNGTPATHNNAGEDISDVDIIEDNTQGGIVLILGRAGVGKSTLMQCLARKWANGVWAIHLKAIFFLNLRYLVTDKKKMTFASLVSMIPTYVSSENMVGINCEWLEKNEEAIALMLDGLDEIGKVRKLWEKYGNVSGEKTSLDWCFRLLKREYLPKSTLLVSSRSPEDVYSLLQPTDTVEVLGLSSTKITSFIKKNVVKKQRNKVHQSLTGNPTLLSISSITFYCATLCRLLQRDGTQVENFNTYTRIIAYLIEMYICRSLKDDHTKKDVYEEMGTSLQSMSQLAYKGLAESSAVPKFNERYSDDDLNAVGISDDKKAKLRAAGLLLWTAASDTEHPGWSRFVHLSIQEYMAMANLLTQGRDERVNTLENLLSASSQFNMAILYLVGIAFNNADNAVLRTVGAINKVFQNDPERTQDIQKALTDVAASATRIPDPVLAIQMVHESQSTRFASKVGEQRFGDEVIFENTKMTLIEVKGMLFMLNNCPSITKIELSQVGLDLSSIQEISGFLSDSISIKETSLLDSSIDGESIKELMEGVKKNKCLEKLVLSFGRNMGDDSVKHVADALEVNTTLKDLHLVGGTLRTGGAQALLHVLQTRNREVRIRMYDHTYNESAEEALEPFIQRGTLTFDKKFPQQESPAQSLPK